MTNQTNQLFTGHEAEMLAEKEAESRYLDRMLKGILFHVDEIRNAEDSESWWTQTFGGEPIMVSKQEKIERALEHIEEKVKIIKQEMYK